MWNRVSRCHNIVCVSVANAEAKRDTSCTQRMKFHHTLYRLAHWLQKSLWLLRNASSFLRSPVEVQLCPITIDQSGVIAVNHWQHAKVKSLAQPKSVNERII